MRYDEFVLWLERAREQEEGGGSSKSSKSGKRSAHDDDDDDDDDRSTSKGGRGGSSSSSSYEGKRKSGLRADEAVEVTVGSLKLTDRQLAKELKGAEVSVSYRFLEDQQHHSNKEVGRE